MSRSVIASTVLVVVQLAAAHATEPGHHSYKAVIDNTQPAPVYKGIPVPAPVPIPETHAFYVRGDANLSFFEPPEIELGGIKFGQEDMTETFSTGVGIGVYFRDSIRGDVTVDYRWDADVSGVNPVTGNEHSTEVYSILGLANLYYDFGNRDRFSPYIGAGIGLVHHNTRERRVFTNGSQVAQSDGSDSVDFAVAAMAGFSYAVHQGFLIDVGYRYLYLGDTETQPTIGGQFGALHVNDIQSHELRFGLRYEVF